MDDIEDSHEENAPHQQTKRISTRARLFEVMLANIKSGAWAVGSTIPSERALMEEHQVSRIALREALSMLRALGVLNISQGKKTTVRRMNSEILGRLFPLMLSLEGEQSLIHVFELRMGIETEAAFWAAQRGSEEQIQLIGKLAEQFQNNFVEDSPESIELDHQFHLAVAQATGNPLFPILLGTLSEFVKFAQRESGKRSKDRRTKAVQEHFAIYQAIHDSKPLQAKEAMQNHLHDAAFFKKIGALPSFKY